MNDLCPPCVICHLPSFEMDVGGACRDCAEKVVAEAARRGWVWKRAGLMEPCWKIGRSPHDLANTCYECGDKDVHCIHCCDGSLLVPASRYQPPKERERV